ncbi:unnamed protein product [Parnassius mnemosyne]|uniref:C2H2-type domain-containing protein n=1 Tax=Parnassius mnemosyne TaxID=213953 RepID=A0AAV1LEL4_9NEOP
MSSYLCFICHSTVNCETNEETRERYREVVGMNLCPDSHLCYICCHVLNKLTLFRSICLKRSLEYPVLFSEKGALYLQRSDIELHVQCPDEACQQVRNSKSYEISYECDQNNVNDNYSDKTHEFVKFEEDNDYIHPNDLSIAPTSNADNYNDFNEFDTIVNEDVLENANNEPDRLQNDGDGEVNYEINDYNEDNGCDDKMTDAYNSDNDEANTETADAINNDPNSQKDCNKNDGIRKRKSKKSRKKSFEKIKLTLEQQKAELEANRRDKKYIESEFKCYNCALGFLFKDTYQAHMMRHEESNGEYRCTLCTLRFASPSVLRSHVSLHSERYRCVVCEALLRPRARVKHSMECLRGDTVDNVACHLCAKLFKDTSGLQQHLRRVHSSKTGRVYPCGICGETFRNQPAVRTHMLKHLKRKFSCDRCPAFYSSPYSLMQHKKRHEMGEERHFCTSCGTSYSSRKGLLAHRRNSLNHQQTVFECNKCSRVLPHRRALEAHERRVHGDGTQRAMSKLQRPKIHRRPTEHAICHLCGKSFKGNSKLNRHLKEVCEKEKLSEEISSFYE